VVGAGSFMPEFASTRSDPETGQGGKPNVHYTVGAAGIVLEVDVETGKVHVRKVALAVDAGKAINPAAVEGQVAGGVLQGLATVLYEDLRFDDEGRMRNPTFTDYKIPTALDAPDETIPIVVEVPQPDGPFGARGIGEHTMIPVAPLVANAIEDAVGLRITAMPITAERLFLALEDLRPSSADAG
jgi:CO/xanthine dehydrogenase Mo-binding subunit